MRSVAVCLGGLLKALPDVAESVQEFLVRPLDADLFVSGPLTGSSSWLPSLALFPSLAEARLDRENVTQFLLAEAGGGWRDPARIKGNWLGCLEGEAGDMERTGSGLCQMHSHRQCWDMISSHERRRGLEYERVIYTRADMRWLGPHLPLSLLPAGKGEVYVVDGEDNGGINDRHWVMPRHLAPAMLDSWDRLVDGRTAELIEAIRRQTRLQGLSTEIYFHYLMASEDTYKLVRRMPGMSFVPCAQHHGRKFVDTSATGLNDSRRLGQYDLRCEAGGPKYRHEYKHARGVADCLGGRAWSWEALWHCWCASKHELKQTVFLDYSLCVYAQLGMAGFAGEVAFEVKE